MSGVLEIVRHGARFLSVSDRERRDPNVVQMEYFHRKVTDLFTRSLKGEDLGTVEVLKGKVRDSVTNEYQPARFVVDFRNRADTIRLSRIAHLVTAFGHNKQTRVYVPFLFEILLREQLVDEAKRPDNVISIGDRNPTG